MVQDLQRRQQKLQRCFKANHVAIKAKTEPLKEKTVFLYLWRTEMYNNSDRKALYSNLPTFQRIWGMVAKVLVKTGEPIKVYRMIYKMVFQAVLLYGSEKWVMTDAMMVVLE